MWFWILNWIRQESDQNTVEVGLQQSEIMEMGRLLLYLENSSTCHLNFAYLEKELTDIKVTHITQLHLHTLHNNTNPSKWTMKF